MFKPGDKIVRKEFYQSQPFWIDLTHGKPDRVCIVVKCSNSDVEFKLEGDPFIIHNTYPYKMEFAHTKKLKHIARMKSNV